MLPQAKTLSSAFNIQHSAFPKLLLLSLLAFLLYSYRNLFSRPFAADDFEWLLNVRGLNPGGLILRAFDPAAQHHFYRPLVWLLLWSEYRLFDQNPLPYHLVSLGLHLANAGLLYWLVRNIFWGLGFGVWGLGFGIGGLGSGGGGRDLGSEVRSWGAGELGRTSGEDEVLSQLSETLTPDPRSLIPVSAATLFALHPAPFEAVVWISAQSELLGAFLLLLTLNLWLIGRPWLALLSLGLALLSKESAIIALMLMPLLRPAWRSLLPHAALGAAYITLQLFVAQHNSVLQSGDYGIGPQLLTNPLRSLALLFAPLPGTEHADARWLIPLGAVLALLLVALAWTSLLHRGKAWRWVVMLGLTLAPTAPFLSPPDSRYVYVPCAMLALGAGFFKKREKDFFARGVPSRSPSQAVERSESGNSCPSRSPSQAVDRADTRSGNSSRSPLHWFSPIAYRLSPILILLLLLYSASELSAREARFAAASGSGGSLWQLASRMCADVQPAQMLLVDPPLAPAHATAIVELACTNTQPVLVSRAGLDAAIKPASVVIAFPGGSAQVDSWH